MQMFLGTYYITCSLKPLTNTYLVYFSHGSSWNNFYFIKKDCEVKKYMEFLARAKRGVTGILPYFVTPQPLRCVCPRSFGLSWVLRTVYLGPPREPGFNFQHLHVASEHFNVQSRFHSIGSLFFWSVWAALGMQMLHRHIWNQNTPILSCVLERLISILVI